MSQSLMPHGDKTIAKICGEKWPRLMTVRAAAAYACFTSVDGFRNIPELSALITERFGKESVDRNELDKVIDTYQTITEARRGSK